MAGEEENKRFVDDLFMRADHLHRRESYGEFQSRFTKQATDWTVARETFEEKAREASGKFGELKDKYDEALNKLHEVADRDARGGFIPKDGHDREDLKELKNAFYEARGRLTTYLDGSEVESDLKKAYKKAKTSGEAAAKIMDDFWGMLRIEGPQKAFETNTRFWDETITAGRKVPVFAHVGTTAAGVAVMGHALFASKTADGDNRSVLVRVLEGAVGALIAGAGALSGAAR